MPAPRDIKAVLRHAARILLIGDSDRLLLFRWDPPDIWITPGGGLEPGENYEQAALRELREETGISGVELGPWVWSRRHLTGWKNQDYDVIERFFLLRTGEVKIVPFAFDPVEAALISEHRWWSVPEILGASVNKTFAPRRLGELLPPIIAGEIPAEPIETGL